MLNVQNVLGQCKPSMGSFATPPIALFCLHFYFFRNRPHVKWRAFDLSPAWNHVHRVRINNANATVKDNASQRPISSASLLCETSVKKRCPSHIDRLRDVRSRKTKFQNFEWKQWAPPCDASSENTLQICQLCNFAHLLQLKQIICFMERLVLCEIHFGLNTTSWSSLQMTQKFQTYNIFHYASQFYHTTTFTMLSSNQCEPNSLPHSSACSASIQDGLPCRIPRTTGIASWIFDSFIPFSATTL